jgi:penicillin-binding protein 1C|tara:strand:+ start:213 stop:773 length:561 start_codon:yes stop_codon:yes gene_type:complete
MGLGAASVVEVAYKTGPSYGHRDAWAIGFDGQHVVAVWMGRPDGTPVPGAFGGALAAPILFETFGRISAQRVSLRPPPADTLILGTAHLPEQLREFHSRASVFSEVANGPSVAFPPDGSVLRRSGFGVPIKLSSGVLPLTILVDGMSLVTQLRGRDVVLPLEDVGFTRISVVDAAGQSDSVEIRLD